MNPKLIEQIVDMVRDVTRTVNVVVLAQQLVEGKTDDERRLIAQAMANTMESNRPPVGRISDGMFGGQ